MKGGRTWLCNGKENIGRTNGNTSANNANSKICETYRRFSFLNWISFDSMCSIWMSSNQPHQEKQIRPIMADQPPLWLYTYLHLSIVWISILHTINKDLNKKGVQFVTSSLTGCAKYEWSSFIQWHTAASPIKFASIFHLPVSLKQFENCWYVLRSTWGLSKYQNNHWKSNCNRCFRVNTWKTKTQTRTNWYLIVNT